MSRNDDLSQTVEHGVIAFWPDQQARCPFARDLGMKGWHCGEMGRDDLISHTIEHGALALR
jgi:hypothetical protein